ncbi:MFS transporter [Salininema proteolyticum]|uniref:MFS transporter n=1 Tax=Salininema proteolyticum TaxID=1607685 RepID=A0ABV8U1D2_9ACTN
MNDTTLQNGDRPDPGPPAPVDDPPASARYALFSSIFMIELGSSVTMVALPLLLLDSYGLSVAAGLAFAARMIPGVLFGPIVGDFIARKDPRKVAAVSAVGAAVLVAAVPWTTAIWQIQALGFCIGLCHMFAGPARLALRPRVLRKGRELEGNGQLVSVERLPGLIGPPLVGIAWVSVGFPVLFLADAAACLIAAFLVFLVPDGDTDAHGRDDRDDRRDGLLAALTSPLRKIRIAYRDSVKGMVGVVARDRFLLGLTLTGFFYVGAMAMGRLFLVQLADTSFPTVPGLYGYLLGAMAVGAVLGGLVVGKLRKIPNGWLYIAGNVLEAVAWAAVLYVGDPVLALGLMFFTGLTEALATAVFFAEAQKRIPERYAGHYYAALVPISDSFGVAGAVCGAALAAVSLNGTAWSIAALIALPVIATLRWYLPRSKTPTEQGDHD